MAETCIIHCNNSKFTSLLLLQTERWKWSSGVSKVLTCCAVQRTMLCRSFPYLFHTETVCIFSHHTPSSHACTESNRTERKEAQHSEKLLFTLLLTWLCTLICNSQKVFCKFLLGFSGKNIFFPFGFAY